MARHPRTIWKPVPTALNLTDTAAPVFAQFLNMRSVDADASMGLQLKRLDGLITVGLDSTNNDNLDRAAGNIGYFKWPADANAPTVTTIDLANRTAIFGRRHWVLQGTTPRLISTRVKTVRLKLGETLFFFYQKVFESSTDVNVALVGRWNHWETQV